MQRSTLLSALLLAAMLAAPMPALAHGGETDSNLKLNELLVQARRATQPFHDPDVAAAAGYTVLVSDTAGLTCIEQPGQGAMGFHYANIPLLLDPALDPLRPEVLMYERSASGKLALVGAEYIVDQRTWDAMHAQPPVLFGHPFHLVRDGNRYGLPAFYELHLWLWKPNRNGLFNDWNPAVHCH